MSLNQVKSDYLSGNINHLEMALASELAILGENPSGSIFAGYSNTEDYWDALSSIGGSMASEFWVKREEYKTSYFNRLPVDSTIPQDWDMLELSLLDKRVGAYTYLDGQWWTNCEPLGLRTLGAEDCQTSKVYTEYASRTNILRYKALS